MVHDTDPHPLTPAEWNEVIKVPRVREDWGLDSDNMTAAEFAAQVYAARFNYVPSMMPGYQGDIFILQGDALGEPLVLMRDKDGRLVVA